MGKLPVLPQLNGHNHPIGDLTQCWLPLTTFIWLPQFRTSINPSIFTPYQKCDCLNYFFVFSKKKNNKKKKTSQQPQSACCSNRLIKPGWSGIGRCLLSSHLKADEGLSWRPVIFRTTLLEGHGFEPKWCTLHLGLILPECTYSHNGYKVHFWWRGTEWNLQLTGQLSWDTKGSAGEVK